MFGLPRALRALALPVALAAAVTAAAPGWLHITIHRGDTLSALAARYHTSVAALVALNHLPGNGNLIYAGQTLVVPGAAAPAPTPPASTVTIFYHRVVSGDTLDGLLAHYHAAKHEVMVINHLPASGMIFLGRTLEIPVHHVASPAATPGVHYPPAVLSRAERHRAMLAAAAVPSRRGVKALIIQAAHAYGVPAALALAVSWQESGFNQRAVSAADGIGAMQVLPGTGTYVSRYLVGRHLNLLAARDNVVAGVALLRALLTASGSPRLAVAGYYQGLASVRAHGMYADTKAYVGDVLALDASFARYYR